MKLGTSTVETTGNLEFSEIVDMEIDQSARALIIKTFIDQYTDPYKAAVREYTSNAADAHYDAAQTRPIEVTLPNRLSPTLVIQDWGIGLTRAQLHTYAQFGASTKREDNGYIGGFGYGSKSGLALSSSFTVVSVKDGRKNIVVIGRDAEGPKMKMMEEEATTDPDGLKVTIPTSEAFRFSSLVEENFFLGWKHNEILVNGEDFPLSIHDTERFMPIGTSGWLSTDLGKEAFKVGDAYRGKALIDRVLYPIDWSGAGVDDFALRNGLLSEVVIRLDNGEVDLPGNRETLIYSKRTREHIAKKVAEIRAAGHGIYQERVDKAPTIRAAIRVMLKARNLGFKGDFTYGGEVITLSGLSDDDANARMTAVEVIKGGPAGIKSTKATDYAKGLVNWHYIGQNITSNRSILVVDCAEPEYIGRGYMGHKQSLSNVTFVKALSALENGKSLFDYKVIYTSLPASAFPKWFRESFHAVMESKDATEMTVEFRREQLKESRSSGAVARPKRDQDVVRLLTHVSSGAGNYQEVKIADLDKEKSYIILQSGDENIWAREMRAHVSTKSGYRDSTWLEPIAKHLLKNGYRFLLANKGWKTANYTEYLPSIVTVEQAIAAEMHRVEIVPSDAVRVAAIDQGQYGYGWTRSFKAEQIAQVKDEFVREWLIAFNSRAADPNRDFIQAVRNKVSWSQYKVPGLAKAPEAGDLPKSPGVLFPLLNDAGYLHNPKAIADAVDYINMKTEARGA